VKAALQDYWSQLQIEYWMDDYVSRCGHLARKYSVGKSVQGKDLWVLEVTGDLASADELPKAHFRYVGNVHGDEPLGRQLLPALAEFLCAGGDEELAGDVEALLQGVRLHLMPTMNPDGFAKPGVWTRNNSKRVDLNRDFPDWIEEGSSRAAGQRGENPTLEPTDAQQPETRAAMEWARAVRFAGSCVLHEGAVVANYPWDGRLDLALGSRYHASPDDAAFRSLASAYASLHATMAARPTAEFRATGGITNGAEWYPIYGGMQDWMYVAGDAYELTLEISQDKHPARELIADRWAENRRALVRYPVLLAYGGAYGRVLGPGGAPSGDTLVAVRGAGGERLPKLLRTGRLGEFFRPLAPGTYELTFLAAGFLAETRTVEVTGRSPLEAPRATEVRLRPCPARGACSGTDAGIELIREHGWLSPWSTAPESFPEDAEFRPGNRGRGGVSTEAAAAGGGAGGAGSLFFAPGAGDAGDAGGPAGLGAGEPAGGRAWAARAAPWAVASAGAVSALVLVQGGLLAALRRGGRAEPPPRGTAMA